MISPDFIEELYAAFSTYTFKPGFKERCSPLTPPMDEEIELLKKPLRELSEEDLGRFPGKGIYTWGDMEDYKYFFPRLTELVALLPLPEWFEDFYFYKFEHLDFLNWPDTEKAVTLKAVEQYFIFKITSEATYSITHLSIIINLLGIEKVMHLWEADTTVRSAYFLADILLNNPNYFKIVPEYKKTFDNWLKSESVEQKIKKAISLSDDEYITYTMQIALETSYTTK